MGFYALETGFVALEMGLGTLKTGFDASHSLRGLRHSPLARPMM
jgi:hypothetical protein